MCGKSRPPSAALGLKQYPEGNSLRNDVEQVCYGLGSIECTGSFAQIEDVVLSLHGQVALTD